MKDRYTAGFICLVLCGGSILSWMVLFPSKVSLSPAGHARIALIPEILDAVDPPIFPGQDRILEVRLRSTFPDPVDIGAIVFSCPCASLANLDGSPFPTVMSYGEEIPLRIIVKSGRQLTGRLRLTVAILGGPDGKVVLGSGLALVEFARYVNAEPQLLTLGSMKRDSELRKEMVRLWCPMNREVPRIVETVSSDPAITVKTRPYKLEEINRVYFSELAITIDPRIANPRFSEHVIVKSDTDELRLPVLGFVEE